MSVDEEPADAPETPPAPDRVERYFMPYVRDSALWPVLFAFLGIIATFLSAPMVYVVRDRNLIAAAGLLVLLMGPSAAIVRYERTRHGRAGALTRVLVGTWVAAAVLASVSGYYDLV